MDGVFRFIISINRQDKAKYIKLYLAIFFNVNKAEMYS